MNIQLARISHKHFVSLNNKPGSLKIALFDPQTRCIKCCAHESGRPYCVYASLKIEMICET